LTEQSLATMLAATTAFQTFSGTATSATAAARIYKDGLPEPENGNTHTREEHEHYRPCAVVYLADEQGFTRRRVSDSDWNESGRIVVELWRTVDDVPDNEPNSTEDSTFKDLVGDIIDDLCAASGTATYLDFHTIAMLLWESCPTKLIESMGVWQRAILMLEFGSAIG
jgi:hypothetical protein